ncbi:putative WbpR [Thiocapsa sp. KS1]|nr:glycosyltransferase [Thiocapsa sp. KS1]CRI64471.1 putative WbpR [Thiocapsa sp. KS1]
MPARLQPSEARIKVSAITADAITPSSRFRVRQHTQALADYGIDVTEHLPLIGKNATLPGFLGRARPAAVVPILAPFIAAKVLARVPGVICSYRSDLTWLQRELVNAAYTFEGLLKRPVIFDVDDAIWLTRQFIPRIAGQVDCVIAGNSFIADWFSRHCADVHVIPTAVDTDRFAPASQCRAAEYFAVGWTGSSSTLKYLLALEPALARFLAVAPRAELRVLCDRRPEFRIIPPDRVRYYSWTPQNEASTVAAFDVGLMPLEDVDWSRGKCSFKMLQYMAVGIPTVVSPVGMNQEILRMAEVGIGARSDDDWTQSLLALYADKALGCRMGRAGRLLACERFAVPVVSHQLAALFKSYA